MGKSIQLRELQLDESSEALYKKRMALFEKRIALTKLIRAGMGRGGAKRTMQLIEERRKIDEQIDKLRKSGKRTLGMDFYPTATPKKHKNR